MKKDLMMTFIVAVFGTIIAYIVTNMFVGEPAVVNYKTVNASELSSDLADPDAKVFNYLALNPTVEVYVGGCEQYNINGDCMDESYYAKLLQQSRNKLKENIGYYDEDGYFHKYELDEEGFYDYNGDFFRLEEDGYRDANGKLYRFDAEEKGYYDGAEYKDIAKNSLKNNEDEEEEEENEDEDEEDSNNEESGSSNKTLRDLLNGAL